MSRTKIEQSLPAPDFAEFVRKAAALPGAKLADIQALAAEYGIEVSLMGARSFKQGPFADYLAELKRKREMAESVADVAKNGLGLADAAGVALSQKIFDDLVNNDEGLTLKDKNTYSLALSRLRTGDHRSKFLEAKLAEMAEKIRLQQFDAVKAAREKVREIRNVEYDAKLDDKAKTERVRQLLFGVSPEGFTPIATTGDAR